MASIYNMAVAQNGKINQWIVFKTFPTNHSLALVNNILIQV